MSVKNAPLPRYEKDWQEFWAFIILDKDGNVNLEQVKKELHDFRALMQRMSKLTFELTAGSLSYSNYEASVIIGEHERIFDCRGIRVGSRSDRKTKKMRKKEKNNS